MSQRYALPLLLVILLLAGCASAPVDDWSGHVEPDYPSADPDAKWEWQPARGQWRYLDRERLPPRLPPGSGLYESRALALHLAPSERLNSQSGEARTLVLKIIQMDDPTLLDDYRASAFRLADLMAADTPQLSASFLRENRVILHPGQSRSLTLDRVKGASHLVLLAGYFQMADDTSVRVLPLPGVTGRQVPYQYRKRWWWPFGKDTQPPSGEAARLKIWLELGEEGIETLRARAY